MIDKIVLFAQAEKDEHLGAQIVRYLQENGPAFIINLVAALVILLVGRWLAGLLSGLVGAAVRRGKAEETVVKFVTTLSYALLLVLVVMVALDRLGIPTTSLAAVLAAGGLAVGLALQGSLSNFAAGILVILFKPFKVGDYVEAGGAAGTVEEIHIFNTILISPDNRRIIVPNSAINGGIITNYSAMETRRIDLVVGCGYSDDLLGVKQLLQELINDDPRILKNPAPVVAVNELGDSSINLVVRPWVNSADYWATKWDLTEKIKLSFDERGFSIPFPQQDIHLHNLTT